jgi:hypothetical protein
MTRTTAVLRFGVIALLLVFLAGTSGALGAESGHQDAIQRALASSTLSPADRAVVRSRAVAAMNAGVPAEDVEIIVSRSLARGADAKAVNRFLDISVSAKRSGLPIGPVVDRIEQGLSKGVPTERIAAASERLTEKLMAAQPMVDALIRDGMTPRRSAEREEAIEATARALEKSIAPEAVKDMGAAVRGKGGSLTLFTSAVDTATYFAGRGMSSKTASRLVQSAVEKGSSGRDLNTMTRRMAEEMKQGAKPEDVAAKMEHENKSMNDERSMERHQDMHKEMRNDHGGGESGPSGMGGMGGRTR